MAKQKINQIKFGDSLTAYEASDNLTALNTFISQLSAGQEVLVDASAIQQIDTAGCQMIDLAITAARTRKATLEVRLSEPVQNAFNILGLNQKGGLDATG